MSNPYDPPKPNQGGQPSPYGAPIPSGGGGGYGNPYGQSPYGGNEPPKKTDAVSITGFVLSLTCCLSLVGAILGFIGLSRTKGGQRKGRWAAISATIIGIIGTLALAGGVVFVVWFANSAVLPSDAEEGQCVNISSDDDDSVLLRDKDCSDDHDAEITWVGTFSDVEQSASNYVPDNVNDITDDAVEQAVCTELTSQEYRDALGEDVDYTIIREDDIPSGSDPLMCYVERTDGEQFTSKQLP